MYALSNGVKMAVVAYKMAAAAILDFEQNAVTFEPFNRSSPNLNWVFIIDVQHVYGSKIYDRPETRWRWLPSWIFNTML